MLDDPNTTGGLRKAVRKTLASQSNKPVYTIDAQPTLKDMAEIIKGFKKSKKYNLSGNQANTEAGLALAESIAWRQGMGSLTGDLQVLRAKNGKAVGFLTTGKNKNVNEVKYLLGNGFSGNLGDYNRRDGIGSQLIEIAKQQSKQEGKRGRLFLTPMTSAVPFYKKKGFIQKSKDKEVMSLKAS